MKEISLLPINDMRIIKLIRISKKVKNINIDGQIVYTRTLSDTYKMKKHNKEKTEQERFNELVSAISQSSYPNDEIDGLILKAVQTMYPDANVFNKSLFFNIDKENNKYLTLRPKESCVIYILPSIKMESPYLQYQNQIFSKKLDVFVDWSDAKDFSNEGYLLYYQPDRELELKPLMDKFDSTVGVL